MYLIIQMFILKFVSFTWWWIYQFYIQTFISHTIFRVKGIGNGWDIEIYQTINKENLILICSILDNICVNRFRIYLKLAVIFCFRSPVNSPHKGQWCGALMFSLICALINGWVNNREAGDLRRHRAHYEVIVMILSVIEIDSWLWSLTQKPNAYIRRWNWSSLV